MPINLNYKLPTLKDYINNINKKQPPATVSNLKFQLPTVGSILNPPITTPPFFDPTTMEQPDLSVPNELPGVFGGALPKAGTGEESQGGGKRQMLANIFNAIASGAAIFGSDKPGEMLASQLENQAQRFMEKRRLEAEQQDREAQREFQRAMSREEIAARREESEADRAFKTYSQKKGFEHDVKLNEIKFTQDSKLQEAHEKARTEFEKMQQEWQLNSLLPTQQKYAQDMENLRTTNDLKQMEQKSVLGALLNASKYHQMVPISKVRDIMHKYNNGIAFTPEDEKTINTARRINAAELSGGRLGGQTLQRKNFADIQKTENDFLQSMIGRQIDRPLLNANGQPVIDYATGQTRTYKDMMSLEEILERQKVFRQVTGYDQLYNQFVQGAQAPPKGVPIPEQQVLLNINTHLQSGKNPNEIDLSVLPEGELKKKAERIVKDAKYKWFVGLVGK